tara:strand:- start:324 stop:716 length:393 start_codon:yes stop_codon:yes gene_type:complete
MKQLREHIKKQIKTLMEEKYPVPPEILDTLQIDLRLKPIIRYVDYLKAANTVPPSYEVFLLNGKSFFIIYEEFSLAVKIENKKYFLGNLEEKSLAIQHINKLLTEPIFDPSKGEEGGEEPTEEPVEEPEA